MSKIISSEIHHLSLEGTQTQISDVFQEKIDWSFKFCLLEALGNFFIITAALHSSFHGSNVLIAVPTMIFTLVFLIGPVSQAHFNASVTLMFSFMEKHHNVPRSSVKKILSYILAQIIGTFMAALSAYLFSEQQNLLQVGPKEKIRLDQAVIWEFIWTSLMLHFTCAQIHPANARTVFLNSLSLILLVSTVIMAAGPFSGGSLNPSVCFTAGIFNLIFKGDFDNFLVSMAYCGAQLLAVPCTFYTYKYILCDVHYPEGAIPVRVPMSVVKSMHAMHDESIEEPYYALPDESPIRRKIPFISMYDDSAARSQSLRTNQAPNLLQNYSMHHGS